MGASFDEDYVRRLAAGDPSVEGHFADYFARLLYIKLRRRLGPSQNVNDVRQETLRRVLRAIREGTGPRQPERLGRFVNAVCENVLREGAEAYHGDPTAPPDPELQRSEFVERVRRVVDALPERDRDLLRDVFLEKRDGDEVCRRHGIEREYLRALLRRVAERFRVA